MLRHLYREYLPPNVAERTVCPNPDCQHERIQHSKNGCTMPGCKCPSTYMDLSPRKN